MWNTQALPSETDQEHLGSISTTKIIWTLQSYYQTEIGDTSDNGRRKRSWDMKAPSLGYRRVVWNISTGYEAIAEAILGNRLSCFLSLFQGLNL